MYRPAHGLTLLLISSLAFSLTGCGSGDSDEIQDTTSESTAGQTDRQTRPSEEVAEKTILFLGNSLSAGYGIDPDRAFPNLIQERIIDAGMNFRVVNAGVSGETTAGGLSRIKWVLQQNIDVLVIELGGNDALRGMPTGATKANLQGIINAARSHNPEMRVILAGMKVPPNLGLMFASKFENIYPDLAEKNDVDLIPFLLKDVGGVRRLNQPDGIHPTARGHRVIAETVWETLEPILMELS